jgi:hypothetical protein
MPRRITLLAVLALLISSCDQQAQTYPTALPTLVPDQVPTLLLPTLPSEATPSASPVVVATMSPSPVPAASPAATSKSLQDDTLGIRFEYPANWEVLARAADAPPGVTLRAPPFGPGPEPIIFAITVDVVTPDSTSVRAEVDQQLAQIPTEIKGNVQRRDVTVGGETAEEVIGLPSRSGAVETFVVHSGKLFLIILQPYDPANSLLSPGLEGARAAYDRVISSWQFLR